MKYWYLFIAIILIILTSFLYIKYNKHNYIKVEDDGETKLDKVKLFTDVTLIDLGILTIFIIIYNFFLKKSETYAQSEPYVSEIDFKIEKSNYLIDV